MLQRNTTYSVSWGSSYASSYSSSHTYQQGVPTHTYSAVRSGPIQTNLETSEWSQWSSWASPPQQNYGYNGQLKVRSRSRGLLSSCNDGYNFLLIWDQLKTTYKQGQCANWNFLTKFKFNRNKFFNAVLKVLFTCKKT